MRIFKTRYFDKFAQREQIADQLLIQAIQNIENGLIDADLGGGLIKQRIPKQGRGKSKGYRSIIVYKRGSFSLFVYGFDKKDKSNLTNEELKAYKLYANQFTKFDEIDILRLTLEQKFIEVIKNEI